MRQSSELVEGITTPIGEGNSDPVHSSRPRFERGLSSVLLAIRTVHVIQGFTCILTARSAYRRPRLAVAAAFAAMAELVWLAKRDLSRGEHDVIAARVDATFGACGLVALSMATGSVDRTSSLNWMMPLAVGGCLGSACALGRGEGAAISAAFGSAYAATTWDSIVGDSGRSGSAIANAVSFPAFFVIGDYSVRLFRRLVTEVDEARNRAVEQSAIAAAEIARNREHRLLHDSAVQTLEAIAAGYELHPDRVRAQARKEAATLRRAIAGQSLGRTGLISGLQALAAEFFDRGLHVELVVGEIDDEPDTATADALCLACREALTNIVKHSGVSSTVVRAAPLDDGVRVTVRDQGAGFDASAEMEGFGLKNSIVGRLHDVGGRAEISSTPGRGTKVELWAPM